MVGAVDACALAQLTGHLAHDELRAVEEALLLVLDLPQTNGEGGKVLEISVASDPKAP